MRTSVFIVIFLLPLVGLSQQPVGFTIQSKKINDHQYALEFDFKIEKGWRVYALSDSALSLEAPAISVEEESCTLADERRDLKAATRIKDAVFDNKILSVYETNFSLKKILFINDVIPPVVHFSIKAFASSNKEFIPVELTGRLLLPAGHANATSLKIPTLEIQAALSDCSVNNRASSKGWLAIFLLGFGGGLLALLAPCVFPMVPLKVSLKAKFMLVSLYVDDRKNLSSGQRQEGTFIIGDREAKFQALNFRQASRPLVRY